MMEEFATVSYLLHYFPRKFVLSQLPLCFLARIHLIHFHLAFSVNPQEYLTPFLPSSMSYNGR